jgi:hypothetical protein
MNDLLMRGSFKMGFFFRFLPAKAGQKRREKRSGLFIPLFLSLLFFFFKAPHPLWADSSNGANPGGTPFMPMMGAFGGGSNQPFKPIRSGILRYPEQGHQVTIDPEQCRGFRYNSNPPTSGLMTETYIPRNDLEYASLSPCTIVNVIHRGNIIIFYDPSRTSSPTIGTLHGIASNDASSEGFLQQQKIGYAVILVKSRFKDPIVRLAWRRILPLSILDRIKMNLFLSRYRGQIARNK